MSRLYGEEQRLAKTKVCEDLIHQLNLTYLKTFEKITNEGFGDGVIATLTQLFLKSRDAAINTILEDIDNDK